jgi:hypothetical protein
MFTIPVSKDRPSKARDKPVLLRPITHQLTVFFGPGVHQPP